jgi:hypothetical protein
MNERIKELADEAGILKEQTVKAKIVKNEDGTWTSILEYPDLEKFAELIVKECVDRVTSKANGWGDMTGFAIKESILNCAKDLKEHFGVEHPV